MKMKKKITALVLGLAMTAGSAVCGAEGVEWLTANDVSLGGVQPQQVDAAPLRRVGADVDPVRAGGGRGRNAREGAQEQKDRRVVSHGFFLFLLFLIIFLQLNHWKTN